MNSALEPPLYSGGRRLRRALPPRSSLPAILRSYRNAFINGPRGMRLTGTSTERNGHRRGTQIMDQTKHVEEEEIDETTIIHEEEIDETTIPSRCPHSSGFRHFANIKLDDPIPETVLFRPGTRIKERGEGGIDTFRQTVVYKASGSFGDVYEVEDERTNTPEAMKIIRRLTTTTPEEHIRKLRPHILEADFMIELGSHPNLVGIRGAYLLDNDFYIFMDIVGGGDDGFGTTLGKVIAGKTMDSVVVAWIVLKIASGLAFMEKRGFTHWDVKPGNILIEMRDEAKEIVVKVADFGSTTKRGSGTFGAVSYQYCSPETLALHKEHSFSRVEEAAATQDVWSYGVILTEMLAGKRIRGDFENSFRELETKFVDSPPGDLGAFCLSLARRCLDKDPQKRPRMQTIVKELLGALGLDPAATIDGRAESYVSPHQLGELHQQTGQAFMYQLAQSVEDYEKARHHIVEYQRIMMELHGAESVQFANACYELAHWYYSQVVLKLDARSELYEQGEYNEAKSIYERVVLIYKRKLGPEHPHVATVMSDLARALYDQGEYDKAKPLYERAIEIGEKTLGPHHPSFVTLNGRLARLLRDQGNYDEAKPLFERAISIGEKTLGPNHPRIAFPITDLARLLQAQGEYGEAKPLYERAIEIQEKTLGRDHPHVAISYSNLAWLLSRTGKYDEAKLLTERAIEIKKKAHGPNHPDLAAALNEHAHILLAQGKHDEAETLYNRALNIEETAFGPEHPRVATLCWNLALFMQETGRRYEALGYIIRCNRIRKTALPRDHPEFVKSMEIQLQLSQWLLNELARNLRLFLGQLARKLCTWLYYGVPVAVGVVWVYIGWRR